MFNSALTTPKSIKQKLGVLNVFTIWAAWLLLRSENRPVFDFWVLLHPNILLEGYITRINHEQLCKSINTRVFRPPRGRELNRYGCTYVNPVNEPKDLEHCGSNMVATSALID